MIIEIVNKLKAFAVPNVGNKRNFIFAVTILLLAMLLRISGALGDTLWVDEAESAINGLTILETGLPKGEYLGIPIYENTLTEKIEGDLEYEFRDSSYSKAHNVVVYHGWLPLYCIALSQAVFGIAPDLASESPAVAPRHGADSLRIRSLAPRIPALIFSFFTCIILFYLLRHVAQRTAALAALTWFGLSGMPVWFGTQSRYYPLTLMMVAAVAYVYLRVVRWGNWRSFIALGFVEGLLFHTHQLSSVAFAIAALFGVPVIIKHEQWFLKSCVAVLIAGTMTIPWALWAGFFDTASQVPNVFHLFNSLSDWVSYGLERPKSLILVGSLFLVICALILFPKWVPKNCRDAFYGHRFYYLFLIFWMGIIYLCFHTLVPAASYFTDRLTLMLLIPFVMIIGLTFGDIARVAVRNWQGLLSVILSFCSILIIHRPAVFYGFGFNEEKHHLAKLSEHLKTYSFESDVRFYATPSNQLIFTYYLGLPVQSTVPVRKSFFDQYPGEIVILDTRIYPSFMKSDQLEKIADELGVTLEAESIWPLQQELRNRLLYNNDLDRGMPVPEEHSELSPTAQLFMDAAYDDWRRSEIDSLEEAKRYPIFKEVETDSLDELWTSFFMRFVDYQERVGLNLNYYDRIQNAEIDYFAYGSLNIYYSKTPVAKGEVSSEKVEGF
jgi:hypothetical protein